MGQKGQGHWSVSLPHPLQLPFHSYCMLLRSESELWHCSSLWKSVWAHKLLVTCVRGLSLRITGAWSRAWINFVVEAWLPTPKKEQFFLLTYRKLVSSVETGGFFVACTSCHLLQKIAASSRWDLLNCFRETPGIHEMITILVSTQVVWIWAWNRQKKSSFSCIFSFKS